jgi:hypothetical protein
MDYIETDFRWNTGFSSGSESVGRRRAANPHENGKHSSNVEKVSWMESKCLCCKPRAQNRSQPVPEANEEIVIGIKPPSLAGLRRYHAFLFAQQEVDIRASLSRGNGT